MDIFRRHGSRGHRGVRPDSRHVLSIAALVAILSLPGAASRAEEWAFVGGRQQEMGGAGVATADDELAGYWNPAAYGFEQGHDARIPFGGPGPFDADVIETFEQVADQISDFEATVDKAKSGQSLTPQELQELLGRGVNLLDGVDADGQGFAVGINVGLNGGNKRSSGGLQILTTTALAPVIEPAGVSVTNDPVGGASAVFNAVGAGADRSAQLSTDGDLLAMRIAALAGFTPDQASEWAYLAEQSGLDLSDAGVADAVESLAEVTGSGTGLVHEGNDAGELLQGISTFEVGLSYGHAFAIPNIPGRYSFGGTAKAITGITYRRVTDADETDAMEEALKELARGSRDSVTTVQFGLDLGFLANPTRWLSLGVVARNINGPKFKRTGAGRVKLAPQVRAGLALEPLPRWIIAADVDITENRSRNVIGLVSRQLSVGTEYRLPLGPVSVAARTGVWTSIAASTHDSVAWTGGIGLSYWQLHLDATAGAVLDSARINDDKYPERATYAVALKWQGEF